ncbi:hypothetical protein [Paenibacillus sp. MMO-58]|uniref:hypothetical protein n=1 Tax=Paenibacillus sp. MMO-58 TaxID=3081290 RepID=UPI00301974F6
MSNSNQNPVLNGMAINEVVASITINNKVKGLHNPTRTFEEVIADAKAQLSVALASEDMQPTGGIYELANVILQIAEYCGEQGIDLEELIREQLLYKLMQPAVKVQE